jgi:hypothetical protein
VIAAAVALFVARDALNIDIIEIFLTMILTSGVVVLVVLRSMWREQAKDRPTV